MTANGNLQTELDLFKVFLIAVGALWTFYGTTLLGLIDKLILAEKPRLPAAALPWLLLAVSGFLAVNLLALWGVQTAAADLAKDILPKHPDAGSHLSRLMLGAHVVIDVGAVGVLYRVLSHRPDASKAGPRDTIGIDLD